MQKYQALAADAPHVHFVARLATYKYYNMDQVVAQALTLCSKISSVSAYSLIQKPVRTAALDRRYFKSELIPRMIAGSNLIRRSYVISPFTSCSTS